MISSRVGSPSGLSMTTSQCSKSQPSSKIVSFGGLLDQLGLGSLREDDDGLTENDLDEIRETERLMLAAAERGRRARRRRVEEAEEVAEREVKGRERMEEIIVLEVIFWRRRERVRREVAISGTETLMEIKEVGF